MAAHEFLVGSRIAAAGAVRAGAARPVAGSPPQRSYAAGAATVPGRARNQSRRERHRGGETPRRTMTTRIIALALPSRSLLARPPPQAKGLQSVTVCGAGGCKDVTPASRSWSPSPSGRPARRHPRPHRSCVSVIGIGTDRAGARRVGLPVRPSQAAVRILSDDSPPRWRALTADRVAGLERIAARCPALPGRPPARRRCRRGRRALIPARRPRRRGLPARGGERRG